MTTETERRGDVRVTDEAVERIARIIDPEPWYLPLVDYAPHNKIGSERAKPQAVGKAREVITALTASQQPADGDLDVSYMGPGQHVGIDLRTPQDDTLPPWVGEFLNRRTDVERAMRSKVKAGEGLSPEETRRLADKLTVPDEFMTDEQQPPASDKVEGEPVAARWRPAGQQHWRYDTPEITEQAARDGVEIESEPLYSAETVERLRRENAAWASAAAYGDGSPMFTPARLEQSIDHMLTQISDLTARAERAEAALAEAGNALGSLTNAVGNMRVPQNKDAAALQVFVTLGPALKVARSTLAALNDTREGKDG